MILFPADLYALIFMLAVLPDASCLRFRGVDRSYSCCAFAIALATDSKAASNNSFAAAESILYGRFTAETPRENPIFITVAPGSKKPYSVSHSMYEVESSIFSALRKSKESTDDKGHKGANRQTFGLFKVETSQRTSPRFQGLRAQRFA